MFQAVTIVHIKHCVCWLGLELYELLMVSMCGNYPAIMDCVLPEHQEEDHVVFLIPPPRILWDFHCVCLCISFFTC